MSKFIDDFVVGIDVSSDHEKLTASIAKLSRQGLEWAHSKVKKLIEITSVVSSIPLQFTYFSAKILFHLDVIGGLERTLKALKQKCSP